MGGHHKKNLRAEKAKVKLKGAKLPKGLNVTKTEFKVRKILIRDQLRDVQIVEGERQLNLKEALSRIKHHSSSFRSEGLRNLKDILTSGHKDVNSNLSNIVQSVAAVCLDAEGDARKESFKTLGALLSSLNEDSIQPFFHILSSYLRCGMNHIQPAIQEDSLIFLDVLLEHVPRLVALHSEKIFQNFLEMISKVRADGNRADRTLIINMGEKQTTVKWRSKVLMRLRDMMNSMVKYKKENSATSASNAPSYRTVTFKVNEPQHYAVFRTYKTDIPDVEFLFNRTFVTGTGGGDEGIGNDQGKLLTNYIEMLMPLLMESWLEVSPMKNSLNGHNLLTSDATTTMLVVLQIISNLWTLVELHENEVKNDDLSKWFCSRFGKTFSDHFLYRFPYQKSLKTDDSEVKKSKKGKKLAESDNCNIQNIIITSLSCRFWATSLEIYKPKLVSLLNYLIKCVKNLRNLSVEDQQQLAFSLQNFLNVRGMEFLESQKEKTKDLLQSTISGFLNNSFNYREGITAQILVILCDIVKKHDLFQSFGESEFSKFLEYLPQLLLKQTITVNSLLAMSDLGKQKNETFLKALEPLIVQVIENISNIQVTGAINAFEGKKLIMNLFYWTEHQWNPDDLYKLVDEHITDKRINGYFKYIISNK